jgi:hypothetical protein
MITKTPLNSLKRIEPEKIAGKILRVRSGIPEAMLWMFGLSFLITLVLGWVPLLGPFIGPAVGGFIGGCRAGSVSRALAAAVLPALLLSMLILAAGAIAAAFAGLPIIGPIAAIAAGALALMLIAHNSALLISAFIGGLVSGRENS